MGILERFKRDITRHRQKAAVLGVLVVVMVVMSARAFFQLQPQAALAVTTTDVPAAVDPLKETPSSAESEQHIRESKVLWQKLREVKATGAEVAVAFAFDASFYSLDPSRPVVAPKPDTGENVPATPMVDQAEVIRRQQQAAVREQSKLLSVKSTTVASGKAWAIVNQQILTVGQEIQGFEISAIRSREVEFKKDGVTIVVKMSDDLRGQ